MQKNVSTFQDSTGAASAGGGGGGEKGESRPVKEGMSALSREGLQPLGVWAIKEGVSPTGPIGPRASLERKDTGAQHHRALETQLY